MGCAEIMESTTLEEEECLAILYPWQCWSKGMTQYEEFRSLEEMAKAKALSVDVIMDAIASNKGNLDDLHFVKRA
ncbi:hypothetical protein [Ralstonia phage RP31]|uniref:Uncharacterized protein n=2 Tax=Ripduovirus RP12 TaxID=2560700 RepID=A0A1L7N186_9CAUD|nr:hypothetical protein FDH28_gp160 [Ralstonia phage RP12]BAW19235.1 hypothetical protein [Ralstonia phage RP12]BAW19521.1 hypothetical protein [Ralstonia phage RP31]